MQGVSGKTDGGVEEQSLRLTTGSSPVYPRLILGFSAVYPQGEKRSFFLAGEQGTDALLSLKTFFMQGMSGN